uniref:CHHC U11-48K-type domain-containing protein n=1 Tax=Gopherus agassizii TaxID=38772 RepID=A0A452IBL7_9SAUR
MDPEQLIPCPYDKNHQIRASSFLYHLVKCRENNKKRAKELATCPYNARHRVPKRELQLHISACTDNRASELFSEPVGNFFCQKTLCFTDLHEHLMGKGSLGFDTHCNLENLSLVL